MEEQPFSHASAMTTKDIPHLALAGSDAEEPRLPRPMGWRLVVSCLIAAGMLGLLWLTIDPDQLFGALAQIRPALACLAVALVFLSLTLRWLRWSVILGLFPASPPARSLLRLYLSSAGLNVLIPLKLGDLLRVIGVRRRSPMPVMQIVGTLALERVFDLVMVGLLSIGIFFEFAPVAPMAKTWLTLETLLGAGILGTGVALARRPLSAWIGRGGLTFPRLGRMLSELFSVSILLSRPGRLAGVVALTLAAWAIDLATYYVGAAALTLTIGLRGALAALALAAMQAWLPLTPGMIGTFHAAAAFGARLAGAAWSGALAYGVLMYAITVIPQAILPAVFGYASLARPAAGKSRGIKA
jgi:uncharacterized membrane protein YbhN (UPF0104 family)